MKIRRWTNAQKFNCVIIEIGRFGFCFGLNGFAVDVNKANGFHYEYWRH